MALGIHTGSRFQEALLHFEACARQAKLPVLVYMRTFGIYKSSKGQNGRKISKLCHDIKDCLLGAKNRLSGMFFWDPGFVFFGANGSNFRSQNWRHIAVPFLDRELTVL